jgi:hypothetical protein
MDDFGDVVYLDVEKTGSSFVSKFLNDNMKHERNSLIKHGRIGADFRIDAFYFISVRNPLDQYLSLYRYGCKGKGAIYESLSKSGYAALYQPDLLSFQKWLEFVLTPKNAGHLGADYKTVDTTLMGLQTFRFLVLSFQHAILKLKSIHDYESLGDLYDREKIHSEVVCNERLREDMEALVASHLSGYLNVEESISYLRAAPSINKSPQLDFDIGTVDEDTKGLIRHKERFLLERFYPDYL